MNGASFFVGACLLAAVLPLLHIRAAPPRPAVQGAVETGYPAMLDVAAQALSATHLRGRPLTQQPPTALEARFAADFPGALVRFNAGDATLIVRAATAPTRQLHPAADCFRAAGYKPGAVRTHADANAARWSCFEFGAHGRRWRVCERFVDAAGRSWTDVSSWYWAALWAQRTPGAGPWWAVTIVAPLDAAGSDTPHPQRPSGRIALANEETP